MTRMNDGKIFDFIYFDTGLAFETMAHNKLLKILPKYDVGKKLLN